MYSNTSVGGCDVLSRRSVLAGCAAMTAALKRGNSGQTYLFSTGNYEIKMSLEFHDNYADRGLQFLERQTDRRFCVSAEGQKDRDCRKSFTGAIAIAHYRVLARNTATPSLALREQVLNVDGSDTFPARAPFERAIQLQRGVGSDIQAFGYERSVNGEDTRSSDSEPVWCIFRQNLYLESEAVPFLIVHWKHTLSAIRVLDIIPGAGTREIQSSGRASGAW